MRPKAGIDVPGGTAGGILGNELKRAAQIPLHAEDVEQDKKRNRTRPKSAGPGRSYVFGVRIFFDVGLTANDQDAVNGMGEEDGDINKQPFYGPRKWQRVGFCRLELKNLMRRSALNHRRVDDEVNERYIRRIPNR